MYVYKTFIYAPDLDKNTPKSVVYPSPSATTIHYTNIIWGLRNPAQNPAQL